MADPDATAPPAAGSFMPATFAARGVTVPFTAPALLGARLRPAAQGKEFLLAAAPGEAPAALPWAGVLERCTPSLHDRALWARLAGMAQPSPRLVRDAALAVAAEGYAGRSAARAARQAQAAQARSRTVVHLNLLLAMLRQGEPDEAARRPPEAETSAQLLRRTQALLESLREEGRIAPAVAMQGLEELARLFDQGGLRGDPGGARLPALAHQIATMVEDMPQAMDRAADAAQDGIRQLMQAAELVLRCGRMALLHMHALVDDIWALLDHWQRAPDEVAALVARPDWIFDGWDLLCGLWHSATPAFRPAVALEMAGLVPAIPAEVADWLGFDAAAEFEAYHEGIRRWQNTARPWQSHMVGHPVEAGQRNEQLRTLCA